MQTGSSFGSRIDDLMRRVNATEPVEAQALALAREGLAHEPDPRLVIRACICAAHAIRMHQPDVAMDLLQRARRVAREHDLQADAMALRLRMAETLFSAGEHARGFDQLIAIAGSPDLQTLAPASRTRLFLVLAVHSLAVDADDSVSLCLRLAAQVWKDASAPMSLDHRAWALTIRTMQLTFAHDAMGSLLSRPSWDLARRTREAAALAAEARDALAAPDWDTAGECSRSWATTIAALAPALVDRDAAGVLRTAELLRTLPDDDPHQEEDCRYWVVAALLELGAVEQAQAVLDAMEPVHAADHWALRLNWLHLRSAVARARGDFAAALKLYETYVNAAAAHMPRMNLRVPQLLRSLTRLPGARPADAVDERPAYLERVLARIAQDTATPSVSDLAATAGVSDRTLREAFVAHLGLAPKEYLLQHRLLAARAMLEQAPEASVEEVAARHGFSHAGRFAARYRAAFGVLPRHARQQ